jgi:archaellum component FlaC
MFLEELTDNITQVREGAIPYKEKGGLQELEDRVERLEELVNGVIKDLKKQKSLIDKL